MRNASIIILNHTVSNVWFTHIRSVYNIIKYNFYFTSCCWYVSMPTKTKNAMINRNLTIHNPSIPACRLEQLLSLFYSFLAEKAKQVGYFFSCLSRRKSIAVRSVGKKLPFWAKPETIFCSGQHRKIHRCAPGYFGFLGYPFFRRTMYQFGLRLLSSDEETLTGFFCRVISWR